MPRGRFSSKICGVWKGNDPVRIICSCLNPNLLSGPKYIQLLRILHDWACKIFIQLINIDIKWCKSNVDLLIWTPSSSYVCKTIYGAGLCLLDVFVGCFMQPSILRTSSRCSARFVAMSSQKVTQNISNSLQEEGFFKGSMASIETYWKKIQRLGNKRKQYIVVLLIHMVWNILL